MVDYGKSGHTSNPDRLALTRAKAYFDEGKEEPDHEKLVLADWQEHHFLCQFGADSLSMTFNKSIETQDIQATLKLLYYILADYSGARELLIKDGKLDAVHALDNEFYDLFSEVISRINNRANASLELIVANLSRLFEDKDFSEEKLYDDDWLDSKGLNDQEEMALAIFLHDIDPSTEALDYFLLYVAHEDSSFSDDTVEKWSSLLRLDSDYLSGLAVAPSLKP